MPSDAKKFFANISCYLCNGIADVEHEEMMKDKVIDLLKHFMWSKLQKNDFQVTKNQH